ncbi:MAG: hypothetical protein OXT09_03800 [Myxococcales bacterium]|nr:hypothetical protein [Myxococcales bacterium]
MSPSSESVLQPTGQVWTAYGQALAQAWPRMLLGLLAGAAVALLWRRLRARRGGIAGRAQHAAAPLLLLAVAGFGLTRVIDRAAVFDDAYISLRYAWNLAEGHGLVFNLGERVEGYTNFLWTLLLAAAIRISDVEPPLLALWGCVGIYLSNLLVVYRMGRELDDGDAGGGLHVPVAVLLLALQPVFVSYGTSGLETGLASLLVNLGVLTLMRAGGAGATALAGLWLILATLTRPDHALFYATGSLVVLVSHGPAALRARADGWSGLWRGGLRPMAAYAAPFALYLAYLIWKQGYYGDILPNTYYAKSADRAYWSQGIAYVTEFFLSSQLWLTAPLALSWLWLPARTTAARRFRLFALVIVPLYTFYVAQVGDFMRGRFFVSLLPLILLGLQHALMGWLEPPGRRALLASALAGGLLAVTLTDVDVIGERKVRWGIADESDFYQVVAWDPIEIDHFNFRVAKVLERIAETGQELRIANKTVGMIGYYARSYVLDRRGLTDAHVAHLPLRKRGRPGHEKLAGDRYVRSRQVHFIDGGHHPKWFGRTGRIRWGAGTGRRVWHIYRYDRDLMAAIRELDMGVRFTDFERYLDRYLARLERKDPARVRRELEWFKRYYFDHNDDPARLAKLQAHAGRAGAKP